MAENEKCVFCPGETVLISPPDASQQGFLVDIERVEIAGADLTIRYKVTWWEGRTRRTEWVNSQEIEVPQSSAVGAKILVMQCEKQE